MKNIYRHILKLLDGTAIRRLESFTGDTEEKVLSVVRGGACVLAADLFSGSTKGADAGVYFENLGVRVLLAAPFSAMDPDASGGCCLDRIEEVVRALHGARYRNAETGDVRTVRAAVPNTWKRIPCPGYALFEINFTV